TTDGVELHSGSSTPPAPVDPVDIRDDEPVRPGISPYDFEEALYILDEAELRQLREEMRRETERDLWRDVLNALLDRLEDGDAERQRRIIGLIRELLPTTLATGQFDRSASLLEELVKIAQRADVLTPDALREAR